MEDDDCILTATNIDGSTSTITISSIGSNDSIYTGGTSMNSDFNIGSISDINISTTSANDTIVINWDNLNNEELWKDTLPKPARVEKMCEHYPALEKAYENFKSIYKMVEQDYKGNHEDKDNENPF